MIHLHASKKLFEKLPLNEDGMFYLTPNTQSLYQQTALDNNPLSGWHGHLVDFDGYDCVFFVHDETRFSLFLPALTKPDVAELNDLFLDVFMSTLLKCGADDRHMTAAQQYLRPLQVDTQCNRSVQGTLNRVRFEVECMLEDEPVDLAEVAGYSVGAWLSDTPRNIKGKGMIWPDRAMLELLESLDAGNQYTFE
ncbi:MAG: hypothetical protein COB09_16135 [Thalassobium sp.]|nr:MAG: hypothetical protein COB09_16135 [Thalassobium sp.]